MKFERAENDKQQKLSWRWQVRTESGSLMILELLADAPEIAGGKVQPLPTTGKISAINIPHSSIVFDLHDVAEIKAELLGEDGIAIERIKHANLVSFTCLKAFAFDQRFERKDAHDFVYCLEHISGNTSFAGLEFQKALTGKHGEVVKKALNILRNRFVAEGDVDGYQKDGPIAVAKFELGEGDTPDEREARALRQREVSDLVERLLKEIS
jgi:hypothetical protein